MTSPSGFGQLVESQLDLLWHLDPVAATGAGIVTQDLRLGDYDDESVREHIAALRAMSSALEAIDVDSLEEEVDRTALLNDLRVRVAVFDNERPHRSDPSFWVMHALEGLHSLLTATDRAPEQRAQALRARLEAIPRFLDQARSTLDGYVPELAAAAVSTIAAGDTLVREAGTVVTADGDPGPDPASDAAEAFRSFRNYLEGPATDLPARDFAVGEDAFNFRLSFGQGIRATAAELHRYGLALVEEVSRDLEEAALALAGTRDWGELVDRLRAEDTGTDILDVYRDAMERAEAFVRERAFVPVPEGALNVVETPDFLRPLVPVAAYQPPGAFAVDRTGWFYVTAPASDDQRLHSVYDVPFIAVHEGYPGHHLQFLNAYAQPRPVRRVVNAAVTVEGWALYCEAMMPEQGFAVSDAERLFQLVAMLWRGARVVLDTGLHTGGLTADAAVDYLVETARFDRAAATSEVRRYCRTPTYQLSYAVGRRELLALREDYLDAHPEATLREFHSDVLAFGGLPVSLIRWGLGLHE